MQTKRQSAVATALLLVISSAGPAQEPESNSVPEGPQGYSVEEIAAALTDSLTSIHSFSCDFERVLTKDGEAKSTRCKYARAGDKWHITEVTLQPDEVTTHESVISFDGTRAYSYFIERFPDGNVKYGTVEIRDTHAPPMIGPECLLGMMLPNQLPPLPELLQSAATKTIEIEKIDDAERIRLIIANIPSGLIVEGNEIASTVTIIVSHEHEMLPTEIQVEYSEATKQFTAASHQNWFQNWRTTEFAKILDESAQVSDEAQRIERWFPVAGINEQGGVPNKSARGPTWELRLENVRLNAPLDPVLFSPKVATGTTVWDMTAEGQVSGTVAGGDTAIEKQTAALVEQAKAAKSPPNWPMMTGIAGAVCLLAALAWMALKK